MKKLLFLAITLSVLTSCGGRKGDRGKTGTKGELIPSRSAKSFVAERPYGMVAIPGGSFVMGMADMDFTNQPEKAPLKTVSVSSFYMDETETTNAQYRLFINYVRDSIVRTLLAEKAGDTGGTAAGKGTGSNISDYAFLSTKTGKEATPYQQFVESEGGRDGYSDAKRLDWSVPLYWKTGDYPSQEYAEVLESMYLPPEKRINNVRTLDVNKLKYAFQWIDVSAAARSKGQDAAAIKKESIAVYPDTTVWVKDFNYAYNEPLFKQYFWHKAFSNYPVVGVTWDQARAYANFRTKTKADYNASRRGGLVPMGFRLPTEAEWEYAAKGGLQNATYPWGGPNLTDDRGCYLANFKPRRGDYIEDPKKGNYMYTAPVKSFPKNGFGLYDMAGNVSEWTESPYNNSTYSFASTLNPSISNRDYQDTRKSVRGGSWKDIGYLLMTGARSFEYKDSARSYIGFRTVQDIPDGAARFRRGTK